MIFKPMTQKQAIKIYELLKKEKNENPKVNKSFFKMLLNDIWQFTDGLKTDYGTITNDQK